MSGEWHAIHAKNAVTVRTHDKQGFHFIQDSLSLELRINSDNTASGKLGNGLFEGKQMRYNSGIIPPSKSGIEWIVSCGSMGKLFESDSNPNKEIELWISPEKSDHTREVEIRMTNNGSHFPMGGIAITRK